MPLSAAGTRWVTKSFACCPRSGVSGPELRAVLFCFPQGGPGCHRQCHHAIRREPRTRTFRSSHASRAAVSACDEHNDGFDDGLEIFYWGETEWLDTDGDDIGNNSDLDHDDGMPDAYETENRLDPPLNDANRDADSDGPPDLANVEEGTQRDNSDTDGDGM